MSALLGSEVEVKSPEPDGLGTPSAEQDGAAIPRVTSESRLTLRHLSYLADGEDFLVGDAQAALFISVPAVGAVALRALEAGKTVGEAGEYASARAGEVVDVLDFAFVLVESGLVLAVDGLQLDVAGSTGIAGERGWLEKVPPELVRPLFCRAAWAAYGLLFLFCVTVFVLQPQYWPTFEDFYFFPDPALCIVTMSVAGLILGACHELYHWLAARAAGVAARFSVSRRLFIPVFETDLSQLWALPRSQRYSAFLAGMAFDSVVLALCLLLRIGWGSNLIAIPPLLYRFLGAVVLLQVIGLGFQSLVFLRTDLYAVLVTALGCYNLYRVNMLYLRSLLGRLRKPSRAGDYNDELQGAHPRDLKVARWFMWLYAGGLVFSVYFFLNYFVPNTVLLAGWMFSSLLDTPLGTASFWEALTIGVVAGFESLLPVAILLWQRIQSRKGRPV